MFRDRELTGLRPDQVCHAGISRTFQIVRPFRGMSVEEWILQLADQIAPPASLAYLQKTNPEEWMRQFRAWAGSHDRMTPLLSDEAVSRESIYSDRG